MTEQRHAQMTDIERFVRTLRRRKIAILLVFLGVTGAALALSVSKEKQYTASSTLLFRDPAIDRILYRTIPPPSVDVNTDSLTNQKLVKLAAVAQRTAERLGGGPITSALVFSKVSVVRQGQSLLVSVTATDQNPQFAARLANTFAAEYINWRREADRALIRRAQRDIQRQLNEVAEPNRETLIKSKQNLGVIAALQNGKAELVQTAKPPSSPSSPKPVRDGILGAMMGLILGVSLAFVLDRIDKRIRDPQELEETYGIPVLGAVPESKALREAASTTDGELTLVSEGEAFRKLRARLRYFNVDRDIRSIVVTSAAPGEGKTVVASHLALAAAIGGQTKVLLLEADLRKPSLVSRFELAPLPGLSELLTHDIMISDVVQRIPVAGGLNGTSTLDVIVAGAIPPNPGELLESRKLGDLVDQLTGMYDLVVIDTPPVSVVADAMPLVALVSGVVVVSWMGRTTRDAAIHLRRELDALSAPTLGVVVNRVKAGTDGYYGYPYYGYGVEQLAVTKLKGDREPV
jgi:capsular exopolysaccharide synthesis family protein